MADIAHSGTSIQGGHTNVVSAGAAGFMTGTDKASLDSLTGKLASSQLIVSTTLTTGTTQPLSLADSLFTGKTAGGLANGTAGVAGIVAGSFASSGAETGTGSAQGGLGSAAAANQPYNSTDFPGGHYFATLTRTNGQPVALTDVLTTAAAANLAAPVYAFISFRSDLGANLKWRAWFYYRDQITGLETPFTPDTSLNNITLAVAQVTTTLLAPTATGLQLVTPGTGAAELEPGLVGDIKPTGSATAAGGSGRFADAAHIHAIGGIIGQVVADGTAREAVTPSSENVLAGKVYKQSAGSPLWIPLGTNVYDWRTLQVWPNDINVVYAFHDDLEFSNSTPLTNAAVLPKSELQILISGAGAVVTAAAAADNTEIGVIRLATGTTSTGAALLTKRVTVDSGIVPIQQSFAYGDFRVRPQALSTGAQEYTVFCGYHNSSTTYFGFMYDRPNLGVNWQIVTRDGGSQNAVDTGVAFTANLAHRLTIMKLPGELGARAFIGGSAVGGGLITTNFPTTRCGLEVQIAATVGATSKTLDVDWVGGVYDYGGSRA